MDRIIIFQIVWILLFIILNTSNAFITNSKLFHDFSEMTTTPKPPQETTPLSELIQIQTDTIKKILSTTVAQDLNINKPISSKCEDIESDLKKSLIHKEENVVNDDLEKRGDDIALTSLTPEQTTTSSSKTTFSLLQQPTATQEYKYTEGQNIILIPCLKRIIQNITTTRRQNSEDTDEILENIPSKQEKPTPYLSLEKIYAPSGQFMYYMYRWNHGKSSNSISTSSTTTTTTTTTTEKTPELNERLRFVVKMPYSQQEPAPSTYPWQFDPYAYYPKDMQPQYMNTPVKYKPIFNIIRTLAVPEEYHTSYMLNDPENNENNKN